MPELPEVEVVRRGLRGGLLGVGASNAASPAGPRVLKVVVRQPQLRWPIDPELRCIEGQRLRGIDRRGKYLLMRFDPGTVIIHLGMSGTLLFHLRAPDLLTHDHVDLVFDHGVLRYNDPRRFGAMVWHPVTDGPLEQHRLLVGLGVEPLESGFAGSLGGELLFEHSRGRKVAIKQFLLAGQAVVGVGNIYCSEALFRAQIRPTTPAGRIALPRYQRLAEEIRLTLSQAIEAGGSSLRDFHAADGAQGYFQMDALVYGRAGQACRRCGATVRLLRQGQRSTFWCKGCQR
jgi:formamidopyrimidine-DNA glycosylase